MRREWDAIARSPSDGDSREDDSDGHRQKYRDEEDPHAIHRDGADEAEISCPKAKHVGRSELQKEEWSLIRRWVDGPGLVAMWA